LIASGPPVQGCANVAPRYGSTASASWSQSR
jgi:hypothetical protein